ncbi:MAG TPA: Gfo/Idh/MocA family oxidoreductase [Bacillota bacterium]|nr:Gfo/Idh/MocA family oxidoreductase [Bacillota bacterium]
MNIGIIGCGQISDIYMQNMKKLDGTTLYACASLHQDSAATKAKTYGIKAMSTDEMFEDPAIDIVVNLTPTLSHFSLTKKALESGKHVYTEKVIAPSFSEADYLVSLAEEQNLYLCAAPDTFLGAAIQTASYLLANDEIGEVTSVQATLNRDASTAYTPGRFTTQKGGGTGYDVGIYYLTAVLSILGEIDEVSGISYQSTPNFIVSDAKSPYCGQACSIDNEDMMMASFRMRNGVLGTFHFNGHTIYPEVPAITIFGTKGIIKLPDPNCFGGKLQCIHYGDDDYSTVPLTHAFADNSRGIGVTEMVHSIANGRIARTDAKMGLHAIEILDRIVFSSANGMRQKVTSSFLLPRPLEAGHFANPEEALRR